MRSETFSRGVVVGGETSSSSLGRGRGRLKSIIVRCSNSKRPRSTSPPPIKSKSKSKKKSRPNPNPPEIDLGDLLFTRDRDYLVRNNGEKVSARRLKGKTVLLYIVRIDDDRYIQPGETLDIIQAYHELLGVGGGIEFVFVPLNLNRQDKIDYSARFHNLFSQLPFPAVPFSDTEACGDRVFHTFSIAEFGLTLPYWVIIDPTGTVVAARDLSLFLFKLFGGAELYPLSRNRICTTYDNFDCRQSSETRKLLISKWDQLLASPTRDFLLSSNGARVPISSLKGKLIGLYFCDNVPCPPRMDLINQVYQQAKLRGYDFEIVQINFHFQFFYAKYCTDAAVYSEQQHYENINWLTLPFKDPSCRKLQRIFECRSDYIDPPPCWEGDCLVIVDSRQADELVFEFAGADVIKKYGIEAYPFTRPSIYETECTRLKREMKLQLLFPPGLCQFTTRRDGFNLVNDSQLKGKRVLVLFGKPSRCKNNTFVSMLKSKYLEQAEEDKFEVVYVSIRDCESSECIQDMPWLLHPYSHEFGTWWSNKIFRMYAEVEAAAFGIDGKLIAKEYLDSWQHEPYQMEHRFPFFSHDMRLWIQVEAEQCCRFDQYFDSD